MNFIVKPQNVCPTEISFDLDGDVIHNVSFTKGCNGNLKAIGKLVEGMTVCQIEGILKGNTCGKNKTSCTDQLAIAVRAKFDESQKA
ncbi:MAG: TIGR03905 family TSCPD domain-containing protein [Clostridia bacterium]